MDRAAVPPQPPRPAARAENAPPVARQGIDNAALAGILCVWLFVAACASYM